MYFEYLFETLVIILANLLRTKIVINAAKFEVNFNLFFHRSALLPKDLKLSSTMLLLNPVAVARDSDNA